MNGRPPSGRRVPMPPALHIYDARERALVRLADLVLAAGTTLARVVPPRPWAPPPRRVLLLRLERIGDLLMTLGAIRLVRRLLPDAAIDLVVGSWNEEIARLVAEVSRVESLDVPWLAREGRGASWPALVARARSWRHRRYDLAINFEGDIRSHLLMAMSRAPVRAGFPMAGGGPVLTLRVDHDPTRPTADNARRLVERVAERCALALPVDAPAEAHRLVVPDEARRRADGRLAAVAGARRLFGLHASGGREIKQWHPDRFGEAVAVLAARHDAAVVLTGGPADQALVAAARSRIPDGVPVVDLAGDVDLVTLAAVLARLDLFVTGDTGPMHLAAAVGTPIVAVFGPSTPLRYAPLAAHSRVVRIDLPCSPCNRIRLPPVRCRGHVPDCLEGISTEMVIAAAEDLLAEAGR